jgi:CRISPR-associated protein Cas8a1/Csx13
MKIPTARGRITDNLVTGRAWYADLAIPTGWDHNELERRRKRNKELNDRDGGNRPTSYETILFADLCYQRSKLMKLIAENDMWDDPHDRAFLEAFWDTLARLYFLERKAVEARGGSRTPEERMNDLNEKTRRELMQAKTRLLLRKTLAEFFAKPAKLSRSEALCTNVPVRATEVLLRKRHLDSLPLPTVQAECAPNLEGEQSLLPFLLPLPTVQAECAPVARAHVDPRGYLLWLGARGLVPREQHATARRIQAARFPQVPSLGPFDFAAQPARKSPLSRWPRRAGPCAV